MQSHQIILIIIVGCITLYKIVDVVMSKKERISLYESEKWRHKRDIAICQAEQESKGETTASPEPDSEGRGLYFKDGDTQIRM